MAQVRLEPVPGDFFVAGIGGAFSRSDDWKGLLAGMSSLNGLSLVIVPPDNEAGTDLRHLIASHCSKPVEQAVPGAVLVPDTVYVCPTGICVEIEAGRFREARVLGQPDAVYPIDCLFRSLAREYGGKAIGVLLATQNQDGIEGIRAVKSGEGLAIQIASAVPAGNNHRERDAPVPVDYVVPLERIGSVLKSYTSSQTVSPAELEASFPDQDLVLRLLERIRQRSGYDFRYHKRGTLYRRIWRRMKLKQIADTATYLKWAASDEEELQCLYRDLLVNVTQFFREPEAFSFLRENVLPLLLLRNQGAERLRVWVPACSTGEEAYSLAMLLDQQGRVAGTHGKVQIFASDPDEEALAYARAGRYPKSIVQDVPEEFLHRYLQPTRDGYQVDRAIREMVVFATHNVLSDPPFSRIDLVSCRNLLIYLQPELQDHAISLFHFALKPGGYLFLGVAETIGKHRKLFEVVSRKHRVYVRTGRRNEHESFLSRSRETDSALHGSLSPQSLSARRAERVHRVLIEQYAPAAVLINSRYQVLYCSGPTSDFIKLPQGEPALELYRLVSPELAPKLRGAVQDALRSPEQPVTVEGVSLTGARQSRIRLTIRTLTDDGPGEVLLLVTFERVAKPVRERVPFEDSSDRLQELEGELDTTRQEMLGVIRDLESSAECLRVRQEDLMSANEELQSTNEELETSSEELQSLNEELTSLNLELQEKIEDLTTATSDLESLMDNAGLGILLLDERLTIKHYNHPLTRMVNLRPTDIGRPLSDLAAFGPDLAAAAEEVLTTLRPREDEMVTSGGWQLRRILPHRTPDSRIAGLVVTYNEIEHFKQRLDSAQSRAEKPLALAGIAIRALGGLAHGPLFDESLRALQQQLRIDAAVLLERIPRSTDFICRASFGLVDVAPGATLEEGGESVAALVLRSNESIYSAVLSEDLRFSLPAWLAGQKATSALATAVRGRDGTAFGVLILLAREERAFTSEETDFLQAITSIIAVSEERHHRELEGRALLESLEERLLQRNHHMQLLKRVAHLSNETETPEAALDAVLEEICSCRRWVAGRAYLPQREEIPCFIDAGIWFLKTPLLDGKWTIQSYGGWTEPLASPLLEQVLQLRRPLWSTELTASAAGATLVEKGVRTVVAFPILHGQEVAGALEFFSAEEEPPDREFLELLQQIGIEIGRIIERHEARNELTARQDFIQKVADAAPFVLVVYSVDQASVFYVNYQAANVLGYAPEVFRNLWGTLPALVHPEDLGLAEYERKRLATLKDGEVNEFEVRLKHAAGDWRWMHHRAMAFSRHDSGAVRLALLTLEDVTERKRLEKALASLAVQQQRRIGQELHDGLGQQLAGMTMMLQSVQRRLSGSAPKEAETIEAVCGNLRHAHEQVRSMLRGLRPVEIKASGLETALRELVQSSEKRWGIQFTFECPSSLALEDDTTATQLFLIAQEAVHNAVKHADANQVSVVVEDNEQELRLTVRDDGRGIDGTIEKSSGLGHRIMTHRAELIGAELSFASPGGVTVTCTLRKGKNA